MLSFPSPSLSRLSGRREHALAEGVCASCRCRDEGERRNWVGLVMDRVAASEGIGAACVLTLKGLLRG